MVCRQVLCLMQSISSLFYGMKISVLSHAVNQQLILWYVDKCCVSCSQSAAYFMVWRQVFCLIQSTRSLFYGMKTSVLSRAVNQQLILWYEDKCSVPSSQWASKLPCLSTTLSTLCERSSSCRILSAMLPRYYIAHTGIQTSQWKEKRNWKGCDINETRNAPLIKLRGTVIFDSE